MIRCASEVVLLLLLPFCCLVALDCHAQLLPQEEVDTWNAIATKMKYTDGRATRESCGSDGPRGFNNSVSSDQFPKKNVTCDCSFSGGTVCHITNIQLKGLNLSGVFPAEFGNLPYLREIDLTRNYLSGTIPTSLTQIPLEILSALGNRLDGTIPKEIGDIATLQELVLEDNLIGGSLDPNLGKLSQLRRLLLSSNNFTGTIPESFGNLRNLTDFRIDGSILSGKIPNFIGNWTNITILDLQGTSMEGPIPSTISLLKNLEELRISDLSGSSSSFPDLKDMANLKTLILRNCSLDSPIPKYIGNMTVLKTLDLSFNRLTGEVPDVIQHPPAMKFIDLSYNNFTGLPSLSCLQSNINLLSSYSTAGSNSDHWCLQKGLPCKQKAQYHSLFINCGGPGNVSDGKNKYEEDTTTEGPSHFFSSANWAYSSVGVYLRNDRANFIANVPPPLDMKDSELYRTARVAPLSLRYYGLCMRKGSYKVRLHFAEIQFTDDETFSSLGRRIFDVSIQGTIVLRDFNIAEEAGGVRRGIYRDFDIYVNGSTLEIHLYWTGKGTTAIPQRGIYGPLISAITVTPKELRGIHLQTGHFTMRQIKSATHNFDSSNKIGEGGFGPVYKGTLSDGTVIAVKQLSSKSKQGNREFLNEIGMISAVQHPNLVKLYGCCIEGNHLLLVYEYMENNSLARALFGEGEQRLKLDWTTRKMICLGIARGLAYLHEESRLKIVHRDIKATNVLLDKDLNAKISDFGLAKLDEEENTHISTRIAGTIGYMAPEYAMRGYLTDKADVYSFGVVTLEIVSGKSNANYRPKEDFVYLLDWAYVLHEQGNLLELVDLSLGSDYNQEEALRMLNLALLCTNPSPTLRPPMSSVVSMLEGKGAIQAPIIKNSDMKKPDPRFKAFERLSLESEISSSTHSGGSNQQVLKSMSIEGPWFDSSTSLTGKDDQSSEEKVLLNL